MFSLMLLAAAIKPGTVFVSTRTKTAARYLGLMAGCAVVERTSGPLSGTARAYMVDDFMAEWRVVTQ